MAQELEDLLIKVESELGDLSGIDSAVGALNSLAQFSAKASSGANSLEKMASALTQLNAFGKSKINTQKTVKDITALKGALETLADFTKDANKSIKQLKSLGGALGAFTDIGKNLAGINDVVKGIERMVDVLDKLSKVEKDASKGIKGVRDLGSALHSFNGLDDNVKALNDISLGLINLGKATESLKGYKKGDFDFLSKIGTSLGEMSKAMDGTTRIWSTIGDVTKGITGLIQALKNTENINVGHIGAIADELKKFNDPAIKGNAHVLDATLAHLTNTLTQLNQSSSMVHHTMRDLVDGFKSASDGFYNVRSSVEAIATDFTDALKPVRNSDLFDTLEKFKHLNDSYKNVGGLGQGLGSLISALDMLNGRDLQTYGLTQLLEYFQKLANTSLIDDASKQMEKVGNLAQPIASLVNALKYTDFDDKNNVLTVLGDQINKFYNKLPNNFDKLSYVMYALKDLIQLASDAKAFGVEIPEDNVISQISKSLAGFKDLPNVKEIGTFIEAIHSLVSYLTSTQESLKGTSGGTLKSYWDDAIDVTPIVKVAEALKSLEGLGQNLASFKTFRDTLMGFMRFNVRNLNGVNLVLEGLFETMQKIPEGRGDTLKGLASSIRALDKLQNIDPNQLNLIADGLTKILTALGGIQGSNNRISIRLDSSGVANFQQITQKTHRAWDDFYNQLEEDLKNIDMSSMFDLSAPLNGLKKQLNEAERMLHQRMKTMYEENAKMQQSRQTNANYEDDRTFQTQASKFARAKVEAQQLKDIIEQINKAMLDAPRFGNDAEGHKYLHSLREEYERYQKFMERFNRGADADPSTRIGHVFEVVQERMEYLKDEIARATENLDEMETTLEGVAEEARLGADELERMADEAERASQEMRGNIGEGFGKFGSMLTGSKNGVLSSFGNLSNMFGKAVKDGTAVLGDTQLASLEGFAGTLGTVATAVGQVGAVIGVVVAVFKAWWDTMEKVKDTLVKFVQSCAQFAKNMLTTVVGAFNAVAGAVSKVVSAVRSGAEAIVVALRKIRDFGSDVISFFGKLGNAFAPAVKGIKAVLSAVTPRFVKTLASSNLQLSKLIKQTHLLKNAVKAVQRYFSMLTRMLARKSITAFLNQMKQAFEDMVLFERNSNDAMLQLNYNVSIVFSEFRRLANQVMAIFEPLMNALAVPAQSFLATLTAMAENMAKFMAIMTGQPYYLRAKRFYEDYGKNLDETAKKAKNLTNGLDELNILNDKKDESGGIEPWMEFEKVDVDQMDFGLPSLAEIVDKIVDFLSNIDWQKIYDKIREIIHRIMEYVNYILSRIDLWEWLGKTLANLFNALMVAWNQFITDFDPKLLADAISTFIINALRGIDWELIHENVELTAKKFAEFWNEIFANQELWNEIAKAITNLLNEIVHYFDTWAWTFDFSQMAQTLTDALTNILKGFDWEQLRHAVEGWVSGIVNFINTVIANKELWKTLGQTVKNIINNVLIEALVNLAKIDLTGLSDSLKIAIQNALDGIRWEDFANSLSTIAINLANAINNFFGDEAFLTKVTTAIANFANAIIGSIDDFITNLKGYDIGKAISEALQKGLGTVDWNTIFKLPADAINALSDAIKGILDSLPEDFNLGKWLAEHLNITMEGIDWETIEKNVEDFTTKVSDYINGLLNDETFWANLGKTTGKTINLVWDLVVKPLANVDFDQLISSIETALSNALAEIDISGKLGDLGELTQKIINAIDNAIKRIDWKSIGSEIGRGMSSFILKIDPTSIAVTIYDAFVALSDTIGGLLSNMLTSGAFYKLGLILANAFYGALAGLAVMITNNKSRFLQAMRQFVQGITDFIKKNKDKIVAYLNLIIDGISDILQGISKQKSELVSQLADILKKSKLAELLGTIIGMAINTWIESVELKQALSDAILTHLPTLFSNIFKTISWKALAPLIARKVLQGIISLLVKIATTAGLAKMGGVIGSFAGPIGTIIGAIVGFIIDKLLEHFGAFDWISEKISNLFGGKDKSKNIDLEDDLQKQLDDALKDVNLDADVDITPNFNLDDSELNWDDYMEKRKGGIIIDDPQFGTITASQIEVEVLKPWSIETDEIITEVITAIDIFADKLHVKEIDSDMSGDTVNKDSDKFYGGNEANVNAGTLSKDLTVENIFAQLLDVKKILSELLEVGEKIMTPLLEVSDKITTPLIDAKKITTKLLDAKKITTKLLEAEKMWTKFLEVRDEILTQVLKVEKKTTTRVLEVGEIDLKSNTLGGLHADLQELEKIVTQLIEALKIVASEFEVESMGLQTLKVTTFTAKELNIDVINAQTLNLGQIIANTLRVGSIVSGGGLGLTNVVDNGYNEHGGSYRIEKPQFAQDDRWSDISGLVPSAEDFLRGFDDVYEGVYKGVYDSFEQTIGKVAQPVALSGNGVTAVTDTLRMNGSGASQKVDDMIIPAEAQYMKDYLTKAIGNEKGALGLLGNLYAESKLLPNNLQSTASDGGVNQKDIDYTNNVNNGANFLDNKGYGLAQWTTNDRKQKLLDSLGGRSVDDLQGQLEYLVKELQTDFPNVWKQLQNAQSIHDASTAVLKGFEKPKDSGLNEDALRWHYGETLGRTLDGTTILDEPVPMDDSPRDDSGLYDGFDEAHVVDVTDDSGRNGLTGTPFAFLETLPIQTEFIMARVYNIIDKWLGRIYRLFESFKVDEFLKDLLELDEIEVNLKGKLDIFDGIEKTLNEILKQLKKLIKDGIECHCDCKCDEGKSPYDPIVRALHDCGFPADDTHLINNTKAKSDNTKAIERLTDTLRNGIECHCSCNCGDIGDKVADAIRSVQTKLVEVKCDCNCGGNCGNCAMGQSTRDVQPTPNYPDNTVAPTGGVINRDGTGDGGNGGYPSPSGGTGNSGWDYPSPSGGTGNNGWNYPSPSGGTGNTGGTGHGSDTKPIRPTGGTGGGGKTNPVNPSGGTEYIKWQNPDGSKAQMYALIDGELVPMSEDLSPSLKKAIARGMYPIVDKNGTPLSPKDRSAMLNYLRKRGWLNPTTNGGKASGGTGTTGGTGGGSTPIGRTGGTGGTRGTGGTGGRQVFDNNGNFTGSDDDIDNLCMRKAGATGKNQHGQGIKKGKTIARMAKCPEKMIVYMDGTWDYEKDLRRNGALDLGEGNGTYTYYDGLDLHYLNAIIDGQRYLVHDQMDNALKRKILNGEAEFVWDENNPLGFHGDVLNPDKAIDWLKGGTFLDKEGDRQEGNNGSFLESLKGDPILNGGKGTKDNASDAKTKELTGYKDKAKQLADKVNKGISASTDQIKNAQDLFNSINKATDPSQAKNALDKLQNLADTVGNNDNTLKGYRDKAKSLADSINKSKGSSSDQKKQAQDLLNSVNGSKDINGARNTLDKLANLSDTVANTDAKQKMLLSEFKQLISSSAWDTYGNQAFRVWHDGTSDYFNRVSHDAGYDMDAVSNPNSIEKIGFRTGGNVGSFDKYLTGQYAIEAYDYWYNNSRKVKGYATGGFPTSGDFFLANEGGDAEYIGSYGNKTTVANNQQIVTAVSDGVARAVSGLYEALEKQTEKIVNAVNQKNYEVDFGRMNIEEKVKSTLSKVDETLNKWASGVSQIFDKVGSALSALSSKIDSTLGNIASRFGTVVDKLTNSLNTLANSVQKNATPSSAQADTGKVVAGSTSENVAPIKTAVDTGKIKAQSAPTSTPTAGGVQPASGVQPTTTAPTTAPASQPTTSSTTATPANSATTTADDKKYESNENYKEIKRIRDKVVNSPYSVQAQKSAIENLLLNQKLAIDRGATEGYYKDYYKGLAQTFDKIVDEQEKNPLKNIYYNGQSIESLAGTEEGKKTLAEIVGNGQLAKNLKKDGAKMSDGSGIPYSGKKEALDDNTIKAVVDKIKSTYGIQPNASNGITGDLNKALEQIRNGIGVAMSSSSTSYLPIKSSQSMPLQDYSPAQANFVRQLAQNGGVGIKAFAVDNGYVTQNIQEAQTMFNEWYKRFVAKGYQIGGTPNSGEIFVARENGTPEYVGSFGNKTAVANNDQIVTAVANGVSMANDRVVNAIQSQTESLSNTIDRKDLNVQIGDRQIAEANNRGQRGLGNKFVE